MRTPTTPPFFVSTLSTRAPSKKRAPPGTKSQRYIRNRIIPRQETSKHSDAKHRNQGMCAGDRRTANEVRGKSQNTDKFRRQTEKPRCMCDTHDTRRLIKGQTMRTHARALGHRHGAIDRIGAAVLLDVETGEHVVRLNGKISQRRKSNDRGVEDQYFHICS
jgi:hypothetical protein